MSDSQSKQPRGLTLPSKEEVKIPAISLHLFINSKRNVEDVQITTEDATFGFSTAEFLGWLEQIKSSILLDLMSDDDPIEENKEATHEL